MASEIDENPEIDPDTTCTVCYAEFLDAEDLAVHVSAVHSKKRCHFCSYGYSDDENYVIHIRDAHILSLRGCKYCTRLFSSLKQRNEHELKHNDKYLTSNNVFTCSQCPVKFTNILYLEQHEIKDHNEASDGVFLNQYYTLLSSVLNVKATVFLESLESNVAYVCERCNLSTTDVNDYINHLKEKGCRSLVCDSCCKLYKNKKNLSKHFRSHSECLHSVDTATKLANCPLCGKNIEKVNLKRHKQNCKAVRCTICNIIFNTVQQLSQHQSVEHPLAISLTLCSFCHKEFVGTTALNKHIDRTHRPDFHLYKYACVYCEPKYFKHPKDLFGHFFSKHIELQPYSCKICDKTFRVRKRFTIHIKLEHNSVGFVEFDRNYHVFFTDKKSEHPFQPTCLISPDQFPQVSKPTKPEKMSKKAKTSKELEISDSERLDTDHGNNTQTNAQTDGERSEQTDIENGKKPLKKRFKYNPPKEVNLININSDFMSATETEAVQTETESKPVRPKRKIKKSKKKLDLELVESDDDEPLVNVQKKCKVLKHRLNNNRLNKFSNLPSRKDNRKHLTCKICKKYCYTQQNYLNHMSSHSNKEINKCVKCSKEFKTTIDLKNHIEKEHASSRLTETLKTLLERRKQGSNLESLSPRERFLRTIKRVKPVQSSPAKITQVQEKLSVQDFIENFAPDPTESREEVVMSEPVVTVRKVHSVSKPPLIKLYKFKQKPPPTNIKLAMPVRFKNPGTDKTKATIKLASYRPVITDSYTVDDSQYQESVHDYDEPPESPERNDTVPEVAQEVMLGSDEQRPQVIPHKIVIPKLPEGYKDIRVAHLLPEAPYYKIVKIDELGKEVNVNQQEQPAQNKQEVTLPTGTKLVTVNPLAHLLGDTPVEKIVGEKNRYYKSKRSNYQEAIAKALMHLDAKNTPKRHFKKKKLEVEQ